MSKALKTIAIVAGAVALIATGVGAAAGVGLLTIGAGTLATVATVAAVASAVSAAASMGSAALQKRPGLKGAISQVMVGATMAVPYAMGSTYLGGMQVYDNSGGTDNKYRHQVMVVSAAGPIESIDQFLTDYQDVPLSGESATGWFSTYMTVQKRLGNRPESVHDSSMSPMPGWGVNHKLSGFASYRVSMKFDKNGKRFASGIPQMGVIAKMVKVYDPRLDSTYPGGAGPQRWTDEATWTWSENPALHALAYARGRFVGTVKIVGAGIPKEAIDIASFVEMANVNDANAWKVGGVVYEAPEISKWENLKRILAAGGARPVWSAGVLRLSISTPRSSLFTITGDDIAEGTAEVKAMRGFRDRHNSIVPKYRAPEKNWEYVQGDAVTNSTYLAEDGELKTQEIQFDLVQGKNQAAQLATYEMVNAREFGPITMTVKPRLLAYRIGEAGTINIPEAGLNNQLAIIVGRTVNPESGVITLTFESETATKHNYALTQAGTPPPTPVIRSSQEIDFSTSDLLAGSGDLAYKNNVAFGTGEIRKTDGGATATLSGFETSLGTAAAIVGQSTLATNPDFAGVTGATRPSDYATRDTNVSGGTLLQITGNVLRKISGSNVYEAEATGAATPAIKGGVRFTWRGIDTQFEMSGSLLAGSNSNVGSQPWQIRKNADGTASFYQNGALAAGQVTTGVTDANTVFELRYDNVNVYALVNGQVNYTWTNVGANMALNGNFHIKSVQTRMADISWLPFTDNAWSSVAGTGRPFDNADVTLANVSSGYSGQKRYGKVSQFRLGETGEGTGDFGAGYTEGSLEWMNNTLIRTPSGVASSINLQGGLATRSTIETDAHLSGTMATRLAPYTADFNFLKASRVAWDTTGSSVQDWKPGEPGANITENRVASSYNGAKRYGKVSQFRLGETGEGTFDYGAGYTEGSAEWTTNALLRTPSGTASAIAGQGPFATEPRPVSALFVGRANQLRNGGFRLGGLGWSQPGGIVFTSGQSEAAQAYSNNTGTFVMSSDLFPVYPNGAYSLQGELYAVGLSGGAVAIDIEWYAGATFIAYSANLQTASSSWGRLRVAVSSPAAADGCRIRCYGSGVAGATPTIGWRRVKLSAGDIDVPFTDEATDGSNMARAMGKVANPLIYNTQSIIGIGGTTNLVPTYTVGPSNVTVNLPSHFRNVTGVNGPVTLSYGAGSIVVAHGAYWIAFIDDPNLTGFTSPTIGQTFSPPDLLYPGRYPIASGTAPAAGGAATPIASPGPSYDNSCVSVGAFVAVRASGAMVWKLSPLVRPGQDFVRVMLDRETVGWALCTGNYVTRAPGVRLVLENGRVIECSRSAPVTQPDMETVLAEDALGALAAFNDGERVGWATVAEVRDVGEISVSHLSCDDGTYLAAMIPGEGIYTHNSAAKP